MPNTPSNATAKHWLLPLLALSVYCVLSTMRDLSDLNLSPLLHQQKMEGIKMNSNVNATVISSATPDLAAPTPAAGGLSGVENASSTKQPAVAPVSLPGDQTDVVANRPVKDNSTVVRAPPTRVYSHVEESLLIDTTSTAPPLPPAKQAPGEQSQTPTPNKIHMCGYYYNGLATSLFPDRTVEIFRKNTNATKQDILMVGSHRCPRLQNGTYPGLVLYIDAENGLISMKPQPLTYYLGPTDPPRPVNSSMEYFFVALSCLYYPYTANDFLKPRNTTISSKFLIYMNSHKVGFREKAFDSLVDLAKTRGWPSLPVATGTCHGSHPELSEHVPDASDTLTPVLTKMSAYRFALVMENSNVPGYVTEKIANAFLSNTVPIYYGTPDVFKLFNREAFVYYDIKRPQEALDRIAFLETNQTAYVEVLKQPILANGSNTLERYFSLVDSVGGGKLKNRIREWVLDGVPPS